MTWFRRLTALERLRLREEIAAVEKRVARMSDNELDTWTGWAILSHLDWLRWELKFDDFRSGLRWW